MKIEQAYSLECEETLDAELAYDYYWAGRIENKRNFECPAGNCNVPITCANLDKLRQDMKVDPYFKTVGEHESDCDLLMEVIKENTTAELTEESGKRRASKEDFLPDIFGLSRPASHFEKNRKKYDDISPSSSKEIKRKSIGVLGQRYVNIKGYDISYNEMFVSVCDQDLSELSKYPRIYYGKAFIDKVKGTDYTARFEQSLSLDGNLLRPSIYISESVINKGYAKKLSYEKFNLLSKRKYPICWVFVYGRPKPANDRKYINIKLSNLDYFELRDKI